MDNLTLRELVMRSAYAMPETEEDLNWHNEGMTPKVFRDIYTTLGLGKLTEEEHRPIFYKEALAAFFSAKGYSYEHYMASMRTKDCVENLSVGQGSDQKQVYVQPVVVGSGYDKCCIEPGRTVCAKRTAGVCDLGKCFMED